MKLLLYFALLFIFYLQMGLNFMEATT